MFSRSTRLLFFAISLVTTASSAIAATELPQAVAALPPTKAKPGRVQGRATDSNGKPLVGVMVHIYGTTMAGANTRFEVKTGADGRFNQRVPDGIYGVRAEYVVTKDGKSYTLALHPVDEVTSRQHDAEEGIGKDFVWLIAGLRPNETPGEAGTHNEPGKYYGGSLQVSVHTEGFSTEPPLPEGSTLIVELTPRGELFDGRPGETLTFRRTFTAATRSSSYWYPSDIPLGRYTLSIRLESPGTAARPLSVKQSLDFNGPFKPSVDLEVFPSTTTGIALPIQITVTP